MTRHPRQDRGVRGKRGTPRPHEGPDEREEPVATSMMGVAGSIAIAIIVVIAALAYLALT
jgi:hypothetical protein